VQNLGILQDPVNCGGVQVNPNDIIVGDDDGLVVGTPETFEMLVPLAREIQAAEKRIRQEIGKGKSLHSMTNYVEHVEAIRKVKYLRSNFSKKNRIDGTLYTALFFSWRRLPYHHQRDADSYPRVIPP
jgi:hypothetical protein